MDCPHCHLPMVRLYANLTTGEELWKCRACGHREKTNAKTPSDSKSKSGGKTQYQESSD